MDKIISRTLIFLAVLIFFLIPQTTSFAEEIKSFDVNIVASKDGVMEVEEKIVYDFKDGERHGIFRTIPLVSKVGEQLYRVIELDFKEIQRDGKREKFEVDKASKETEVKIGDPDKTISGVHTYLIKYTVRNGIGSNYETHDEIYWNVTGNNWEVPILSASSNITTDFNVSPTRAVCFTRSGEFNAQFCTFDAKAFNPITTTSTIEPGDGLTVVMAFPADTFPASTLQKSEPFADPDFLNLLKIYGVIWVLLNIILAPYLLFWFFKHKAKKGMGKVSVNFDIPDLTPAEAGIIDNIHLEKNDVIATLFDLAIRKYLKIEEVKTVKTLRPDETDYKFVKLKSYEEGNEFEKELFEKLFTGSNKEVLLKDLKSDFYLTFSKMEEKVFDSLVKKGYYIKNPKTQMAFLGVSGIIAVATLNIFLGGVLFFLSRKLNGRTSKGDKMDFQVDGLKIFLKNMKRHHLFQAKNLITVEKYIPFAIAFGMHEQFMAQLKEIYPKYNPSWYSGNTSSFYGHYPMMFSSFDSNITTMAPSSSSGFSGGGFSGGGGGGGGGGSW